MLCEWYERSRVRVPPRLGLRPHSLFSPHLYPPSLHSPSTNPSCTCCLTPPLTLTSLIIPPTIPTFNYWCCTKQTKVFVNLPFSLFPLLFHLLGSYGLNQLTYRHSFRSKDILCKLTILLSLSIQPCGICSFNLNHNRLLLLNKQFCRTFCLVKVLTSFIVKA